MAIACCARLDKKRVGGGGNAARNLATKPPEDQNKTKGKAVSDAEAKLLKEEEARRQKEEEQKAKEEEERIRAEQQRLKEEEELRKVSIVYVLISLVGNCLQCECVVTSTYESFVSS